MNALDRPKDMHPHFVNLVNTITSNNRRPQPNTVANFQRSDEVCSRGQNLFIAAFLGAVLQVFVVSPFDHILPLGFCAW